MINYDAIQGLEERSFWKHFADISVIPRGSGVPDNQKGISNYVFSFIKGLGLEVYQDDHLNVVARKPASEGYEDEPTVMLQAHLDMICEKELYTSHDFKKDPIRLIREGDTIMADGTTLGADDGIGVAFIMSILEDNSLKHPDIEAVFTTDEETDMGGAFNLDYSKIKSRLILNLDTEAIGVCGSGELELEMTLPIKREPVRKKSELCRIKIAGLKGGHSGMNSMDERGNAILILTRLLLAMQNRVDFRLADITGGQGMSSAFARNSTCVISYPSAHREDVTRILEDEFAVVKKELERRDPGVKMDLIYEVEVYDQVIDGDTQDKLLDLLTILPDGLFSLNREFPGAMESTSNIGVIETREDEIFVTILIRSFLPGKKYFLLRKAVRLCELLGISHKIGRDLPHWEYSVSEKLMKILNDVYPDTEFHASQGTLESGIFNMNIPDSTVISLGSPYYEAHSPSEYLSIAETEDYWDMLIGFLERLKDQDK
ncbi:MAG: beta-Ala-His dipeptidase [Gudongella sp.]|nr:beta-Ala-His dipeptidase [Gudongella sp.]